MRALRLSTWHSEAELVDVEVPSPGPGEVLVRIGAAGACHSDLDFMHGVGERQPFAKPFILGHENAGWIHEVGAGVTAWEPGEAVVVYGAWGCGSCERCGIGLDNYCEGTRRSGGAGAGLGIDGGMAEFLLVPDVRYLLALPEGLTPVQAAPLTDAGLASYHAVRRSLPKLTASSTALVIGVGGLGHMAIQILKATCSARIIAVDPKQQALSLALSYGADLALPSDEATVAEVRAATGGHGVDVVLDFVGSDSTLDLAASSARTLADITCVGVAGGTLPWTFMRPAFEVSVQSTYWGSRQEMAEVLALASRGLLSAHTTTYPLEQALAAYRDLAAGRVTGRAVIIPG